MQLESTAKCSEYYYSLDNTAKQRYKVKLELVGAFEDPYYIAYKRGIVSVDWNNCPQVEYPDIYRYLIQTPSIHTGESLKAYKSLEAYNLYINGWVEDIAVYTISGTSVTSVAIGSVKHSQRLSSTSCKAWVAARNEGSILCAHCSCMAGLGEACSHIGALLFTLDRNTHYQKTTTCTSLPCSWLPPTFQNVSYSELAKISFATPQHKRCRSEQVTEDLLLSPQAKKQATKRIQIPSTEELETLYSSLSKSGCCKVHRRADKRASTIKNLVSAKSRPSNCISS